MVDKSLFENLNYVFAYLTLNLRFHFGLSKVATQIVHIFLVRYNLYLFYCQHDLYFFLAIALRPDNWKKQPERRRMRNVGRKERDTPS